MSTTRKILIAVPVLLGAVVLILVLAAPSMQRSFFYPKPKGLPRPATSDVARALAFLYVAVKGI